jgi:hypothetical protein
MLRNEQEETKDDLVQLYVKALMTERKLVLMSVAALVMLIVTSFGIVALISSVS